MITYRPAVESDFPLIFSLIWESNKEYADQYRSFDADALKEDCYFEAWHILDFSTMILWNGEAVGFYNLTDEYNMMMELYCLIIHPQYRSKGIGTAAVQKIQRETKLPVYLFISSANHRGIAFYERLGFWLDNNSDRRTRNMLWNPNKKDLPAE